MGTRKKNNAIEALRRAKAKILRDKKKLKRAAKPATAGQKLHAQMHDRKSS